VWEFYALSLDGMRLYVTSCMLWVVGLCTHDHRHAYASVRTNHELGNEGRALHSKEKAITLVTVE